MYKSIINEFFIIYLYSINNYKNKVMRFIFFRHNKKYTIIQNIL